LGLLDDIEIGTDDVVTVAVAALGDRLSGIEIDGKVLPVKSGQFWPEDIKDLPVLLVYSTSETYGQGAGRQGNRMERIDAILKAVVVFAKPSIQAGALERSIGRVRAEVKARIAGDPYLKVDGQVWATDLAMRNITKGLSGAGAGLVLVNDMQVGCTIHAREGSRLPAHYQGD